MSDTTIDEPRGTFGYERKVNLGDYESATASAFVQFPIDWSNDATTAQAAKDAAFQAKMAVLEQLGIKAEYDSEAGILREVIEKTFGNVTKVTVDNVDSDGGSAQVPAPARSNARPTDGPACPTCEGPMYDNRNSKTNPKQPDYRCKDYKNGCEGVIWPERKGR